MSATRNEDGGSSSPSWGWALVMVVGTLGAFWMYRSTARDAADNARLTERVRHAQQQPRQQPTPYLQPIIVQPPEGYEMTRIAVKQTAETAQVQTPPPVPILEIARPAASPLPLPPQPDPPMLSGMDEMRQRASQFRPTMTVLAHQADQLDTNFRRYIDGCYQKFTTANSSGQSTGSGYSSGSGGARGRDWFVAWDSRSSIAWQESWEGQSVTSNASGAGCRMLWSDIRDASYRIRSELDNIDELARRGSIIPGVMRDLRAEYGLDYGR